MPSKPPQKQYAKVGKQYSQGAVGNFYSSSAWIKLRNYKRLLTPLCEQCEKVNILTPFHTIDHIKPISEGGEPLDFDNLQTLCKQCHAIKTGKETSKRKYINNK